MYFFNTKIIHTHRNILHCSMFITDNYIRYNVYTRLFFYKQLAYKQLTEILPKIKQLKYAQY